MVSEDAVTFTYRIDPRYLTDDHGPYPGYAWRTHQWLTNPDLRPYKTHEIYDPDLEVPDGL